MAQLGTSDLLSRCLFPTGTLLLNGVVSDQVRFLRPLLGLRLDEKTLGTFACLLYYLKHIGY